MEDVGDELENGAGVTVGDLAVARGVGGEEVVMVGWSVAEIAFLEEYGGEVSGPLEGAYGEKLGLDEGSW